MCQLPSECIQGTKSGYEGSRAPHPWWQIIADGIDLLWRAQLLQTQKNRIKLAMSLMGVNKAQPIKKMYL